MKKICVTLAALGLALAINTSGTTEAKADGGTVALGVGAYLLVDALMGQKCNRDEWPFNIARKVAEELHGQPGCHRPYDTPRYHRHHRQHDRSRY